ncbi:MAG: dicarboxylate/amino acid:cation symporter [Oscillospiraceae bacterium]|nr:dicarboxylate/amino acid:cation symporter [Oscillospiraceae bacterium]
MQSGNFFKNNWFLLTMVLGMVAGAVVGAVWPGATCLEPLGTIFINMMFCVVVPMVFFSISRAGDNMVSDRKAGQVMITTIITFLCTAAIAAIIMYIIVRIVHIVPAGFEAVETAEETEISVSSLIINFFTKPDFIELFSRRAILPLIVAAILFGFGVQMAGGQETMTAKLLNDINTCLMKTMRIITYYAPIGFFAYLVATYGPALIGAYGKTLIVYYIVAFAYMFIFAPIYAKFGGGQGAAKEMFRHLFPPAAVSFGTCSSVATIPTNMEVCEDTGISKDVSEIVIPLGATIHMDGSAMSAIVKVAFLFGIFGLDFGTGQAILAIIIAVFSSVAMSGIPGGGGTGEMVLCSIFFPEQMAIALPIAWALGDLVDPPATMVNAAMDYVSTYIVSRYVDGKDWLQKRLHPAEEVSVSEE